MILQQPRIFLIHALRLSIQPSEAAFKAAWPEASLINVLDDSLSRDRALGGASAQSLVQRFLSLGRYARMSRADAVFFTCSAFDEEIDAVARDLFPLSVIKPYTAMFAQALAIPGRVAVLVTFRPTIEQIKAALPAGLEADIIYCPNALAALETGDGADHDNAITKTARGLTGYGGIVLAQFSMARAAAAVVRATGLPVLTAPHCAVEALRAYWQTGISPHAPTIST